MVKNPDMPLGQGRPVRRVRRPSGLPSFRSHLLHDRLGHQARWRNLWGVRSLHNL